MLGAQIGGDRVTFAVNRANPVWADGSPSALSPANSIINLAGGQLAELSSNLYRLTWNTGESITVANSGTYFNYTVTLAPNDGPGSVKGLLGADQGRATTFGSPTGRC